MGSRTTIFTEYLCGANMNDVLDIGKILQHRLQLSQSPFYTWPIFPEWKVKVEAVEQGAEEDSTYPMRAAMRETLKLEYLQELSTNHEMQLAIVRHDMQGKIEQLHRNMTVMQEKNDVLGDDIKKLEDRYSKVAYNLSQANAFRKHMRVWLGIPDNEGEVLRNEGWRADD